MATVQEYNNLQKEKNKFKKLIGQQKDYLVYLDQKITVADNEIQKTVSNFRRGKKGRQRKSVLILENKLNQETLKFGKVLCSNMDYRTNISHLLQQKSIGCKIKETFNRQLAAQQCIMGKQAYRSTIAFHEKSIAENQILEAEHSFEEERAHFSRRKIQLKTANKHNAKLCTFVRKKLQEIIPFGDDEDSKERKREQLYQNDAKKLEMYMQGHRTLVDVTGETDLHRMGIIFIQNEQRNFAHTNYINELLYRENMLIHCTEKMKHKILVLEQENKGHDEQTKNRIKDLEAELEESSGTADSLEKQRAVVQETLDQLKFAINDLLDEITHGVAAVTFDNTAHFTTILEDTVSDLLIQANMGEDEQMKLPPQNLFLANTDLLPECETVVDKPPSRVPSRSLKSA